MTALAVLKARVALRISSDRDDRMGAKIKTPKKSLGVQTKPQKITGPKFNHKKISCLISKSYKFLESIEWCNTKNRNISHEMFVFVY